MTDQEIEVQLAACNTPDCVTCQKLRAQLTNKPEGIRMNTKLMALIEADHKAPIVRGLIRRDYKLALTSNEVEAMTREDLIKAIEAHVPVAPPVTSVDGIDWSAPELPWPEYRLAWTSTQTVRRWENVTARRYATLEDLSTGETGLLEDIESDIDGQSNNIRIRDQDSDSNEDNIDGDNNGNSEYEIVTERYRLELATAVCGASDASILNRLLLEAIPNGIGLNHQELRDHITAHPRILAECQAKVQSTRQAARELLEEAGEEVPERGLPIPAYSQAPTVQEVENLAEVIDSGHDDEE